MRRALLLTLLVACRRAPAPVTLDAGSSDAPPDAGSAVTSATTASSPAPVASVEPAAPRSSTTPLAELVPPAEADSEHPMKKLGTLVVWGDEDGAFTRVVGKRGNEKPRLLRRTSGKVRAIDAVDAPGGIVVAWASELEAGGTQLVALVTASDDLSTVTAPTTLAMTSPIQGEARVAVAKNPRGGVLVVHQGPAASCTLMDQPTECLTFEVKQVSAAGVVMKRASAKLHGGPSPEYRLLDVDGTSLAVLGSSMRGGRTFAGVVVPYEPSDPLPTFRVPECGGMAGYFPDLVRGVNGEIVSVCLDSRYDHPKCVRPLRGDADRCLRVAAVARDGKDLAPAVQGRSVAVQRVDCGDAGNPRLVLESGTVLALETKLDVVRDFAACAR